MATTGLPASQLPPGEDWIARKFRDLEQQIRELRAARSLEAARIGAGGISITDGALTILDGAGQTVVQVGLLPDSSYGVAAIDPSTDQLVSLATLAFGMRAANNDSLLTITATSWDDPDTGPAGPTISSVPIGTTGRCAVLIGGELDPSIPDTQVGEVQMSVAVSGATSRAAGTTVVASLGRRQSGTGGNDLPSGTLGNFRLLTGLNPGSHTFAAQYQRTGSANNSFVTRSTVIVIPF